MCDIITTLDAATSNVELICMRTGKPITEYNDYGMFCKTLCDMQEKVDLEALVKDMLIKKER